MNYSAKEKVAGVEKAARTFPTGPETARRGGADGPEPGGLAGVTVLSPSETVSLNFTDENLEYFYDIITT